MDIDKIWTIRYSLSLSGRMWRTPCQGHTPQCLACLIVFQRKKIYLSDSGWKICCCSERVVERGRSPAACRWERSWARSPGSAKISAFHHVTHTRRASYSFGFVISAQPKATSTATTRGRSVPQRRGWEDPLRTTEQPERWTTEQPERWLSSHLPFVIWDKNVSREKGND